MSKKPLSIEEKIQRIDTAIIAYQDKMDDYVNKINAKISELNEEKAVLIQELNEKRLKALDEAIVDLDIGVDEAISLLREKVIEKKEATLKDSESLDNVE